MNVLAGEGDLPAQCWYGCVVLQVGGGGRIRVGSVGASMDGNGVAGNNESACGRYSASGRIN